MGLDSYHDSDEAFDFVSTIEKAIGALCKKELKNKANSYNSVGWVNIGLFAEHTKKAEKKVPPFCIECKYFYQEMNSYPRCIRDVGKIKDIDIVTGMQNVFSFSDAPYCSAERIDFESAERRRKHCCLDAQFFVRKNVEVAEQPDQKDK